MFNKMYPAVGNNKLLLRVVGAGEPFERNLCNRMETKMVGNNMIARRKLNLSERWLKV